MVPFCDGHRRLMFKIVAFISFLAFCYEAVYLSQTSVKLITRGSSLLVKDHQPSNTRLLRSSELLKPKTTLSPEVVKKLDAIYEHMNVSRTNVSRSIFPAYQIGEYLMLNPNICTDAPIIDVIIIVHTAPKNVWRRLSIRTTFAYRDSFLPKQIRIAFLLGMPKDPSLEEKLEIEHKTYSDTIMGDFYDDYHNLTLKGVMGYHWVGEYCPNARVVLKIDDDVVVDMYALLSRYMGHIEGKTKSIFCNVWSKPKIDRNHKWKLPYNIFRGLERYPYVYCSGMMVLLTPDLIKPLYEAAKVTPFFWIDDIFLFGILPKVVGGVTFYNYQLGQNISNHPVDTFRCIKKHGHRCSFLSTLVHGQDTYQTWRVYNLLRNKTVDWHVQSHYVP